MSDFRFVVVPFEIVILSRYSETIVEIVIFLKTIVRK